MSKRSWSYIRLYDDLPGDISDLEQGEIVSVRSTAEIFKVTSQSPLTLVDISAGQVSAIISEPPSGKCVVTNLFLDPSTERLAVEYDNTPKE